jgi:hypothetical protein
MRFHLRWTIAEMLPVSSSHQTGSGPKPAHIGEQPELIGAQAFEQLLVEKPLPPSSSMRTCASGCRLGKTEFRPSSIHLPRPYDRPAIDAADLRNSGTPTQQVKPSTQPSSKPLEAIPKETDTWMVSVSNVYKDPDENYGHGEGDDLTVLVHGETAVGGLNELEGSQQDPSPICMTGTFHNGFLRLQNYPADFTYHVEQITMRGKVYEIPHGHAFHGRIAGGPFHSDPKGTDPHFPAVVTLQSVHDELENSPSMIADYLATDSCACQWKKHVSPNSFITAKCDSPTKSAQ